MPMYRAYQKIDHALDFITSEESAAAETQISQLTVELVESEFADADNAIERVNNYIKHAHKVGEYLLITECIEWGTYLDDVSHECECLDEEDYP